MTKKCLISILNWNSSADTIRCVASVFAMLPISLQSCIVHVVDNGSELSDYDELKVGLVNWDVQLTRNSQNLGFSGGHNLSIRMAEGKGCDYVWLLNSDAIADPDSLAALVAVMDSDAACGSCSPLIVRLGNAQHVDFCGASHNWTTLGSDRPVGKKDAPEFANKHQTSMWVVGTAVLFRVAALKQVGYLDERLFAYFEDDDIGERLIKAGWTNRMVFDSQVQHACFDGVISDRKPYYFYLMTRNSFHFFLLHTPASHRRLLRLRLIDYALVAAMDLQKKGMRDKANACLLGMADGLVARYGPPELTRAVPIWVRLLMPVGRLWNSKWFVASLSGTYATIGAYRPALEPYLGV